MSFSLIQGVIQCLPADTILLRQTFFLITGSDPVSELIGLLRGELLPGSDLFTLLSGSRNTFPLAFPDHTALELGKGTHHLKHELVYGITVTGEDQVLFVELDTDAFFSQVFHQFLQVFKASGKAINGMNMEPVTCPQVSQAGF